MPTIKHLGNAMDVKVLYGFNPPPKEIIITPTLYLGVQQNTIYYLDTDGNLTMFGIGSSDASVWGGIQGNIEDQTDLIEKLNSKLNTPTEITAGTATKVTYDVHGLITSVSNLLASDIPVLTNDNLPIISLDKIPTLTADKLPDLSSIYQVVSGRDTSITEILSENNHYPTSKAVYDYGQAIAATIPAGGLKVPVSIAKESDLPSSGQSVGDYYFIQDMDVTASGRTGRAWWGSDSGSVGWYKVIDQYYGPDGTTLQLNVSGQLELKSSYTDNRYLRKDDNNSQTVSGPVALSSNLGVTGNTSLTGNLSVGGTSTLTGLATLNGGATFGAEPTLSTGKTSAVTNDGTKFATEAQVYNLKPVVDKYIANITVGSSATGGNIVHNLDTEDIISVTFINATTDEMEVFDWSIVDENTVSWSIASPIGADTDYSVIVLGALS